MRGRLCAGVAVGVAVAGLARVCRVVAPAGASVVEEGLQLGEEPGEGGVDVCADGRRDAGRWVLGGGGGECDEVGRGGAGEGAGVGADEIAVVQGGFVGPGEGGVPKRMASGMPMEEAILSRWKIWTPWKGVEVAVGVVSVVVGMLAPVWV